MICLKLKLELEMNVKIHCEDKQYCLAPQISWIMVIPRNHQFFKKFTLHLAAVARKRDLFYLLILFLLNNNSNNNNT